MKRLKNNNGFSLIEIAVAISILGLTVLTAMNIMVFLRLQLRKATLLSDVSISQNLGERFLYLHFKNALPSYNNLAAGFSTGTDGENFYDLNATYPASLRPADERKRDWVLSPTGSLEAYVLTIDPLAGPPLYIDPARFFSSTAATETTSGTLTYLGPNPGSYISSQAPRFWEEGKFLYFYSTSEVRPPGTPEANFMKPYGFLGRVQGGQVIPENLGGAYSATHPIAGNAIVSLEDFFRRLPSSNGGIPVLMVIAVEFLRYQLVPDATFPQIFNLSVSKWDGTNFVNPQVIANDIERVTLNRPSVDETLVGFKIELVRRE